MRTNTLSDSLDTLRRLVAAGRHEHTARAGEGRISLGVEDVDARIGGGLQRAALHEIIAPHEGDAAAASTFALLLALARGADNAVADNGPVVWIREDRAERRTGMPYAPGLAALGLDPARLVMLAAPDALTVLRVAADCARCGAIGAVLVELWGKAPAYDLTASRRLHRAAEAQGLSVFAVRMEADARPSAAATRWQVASAPSVPLEANAPGLAAFDISLLRQRGGADGLCVRLEWNHEQRRFERPSLSGGMPAFPASRALDAAGGGGTGRHAA